MSDERTWRVVGQRVPKVDGIDKVTGVAQFGADIKLPRMLVGRICHSQYAHARVKRIDTRAAERVPGVKAVITAKDLVGVLRAGASSNPPNPRSLYLGQKVLASEKVLFHGHPVAAVAATTPEAADEAVRLIDVEYEPLTPVLELTSAMEFGSPVLHESLRTVGADPESPARSTNVAERLRLGHGEVEEGLRESDSVIERSFRTSTVHQGYIEPDSEAAWAHPDGSVVVWANTQAPHVQRNDIAYLLGIPLHNIKVIPTEVGGAFGGKETARVSALCVALSRKALLPVKITLRREEILRAGFPGTAIDSRISVGVKSDGTITAIDARVAFDAGAFPGAPLRSALRRVFSHYRTPNLRIDAFDVVTNKPPVGAYRAPGATPLAFALESVIDDAAAAIGMDPLELRLLNVSRAGDRMPDGAILSTISLVDVLERVKTHSCWTEPIGGPHRGRGIAVGMWNMPGGTTSCHVVLNRDGSVTLVLGTVDLSSTRTTLSQIAAEALELDLSEVKVLVGDTDTVAYTEASAGDKVTYVTSKAVIDASQDLLKKMAARVAAKFEVPTEHVRYARKQFWVEGAPEMSATFENIAVSSTVSGGALSGSASRSEVMGQHAIAPNAAAHVADVEVDPETGKVRILRYTVFQDAGRAINPQQVEGQMQGGAVQGIGWALSEGYDYDEEGVLRNASLLDYRLPTALDVPAIDTVVLEIPSPDHPYGVRGVGQVPIVPPAGAIGNAIFHAVGVRMTELPMTPARVLQAIGDAVLDQDEETHQAQKLATNADVVTAREADGGTREQAMG